MVTFATMKRHLLFLIVFFFVLTLSAQPPDSGILLRKKYIDQYKELAIQEMQAFGIPASIKLAQALLESGAGRGELAQNANNHFGIKCKKEWQGDRYFKDDDLPKECFRKYNNVENSYRDHSLFLTTSDRYKSLFRLPMTDYKSWARGLKEAGYATNPTYAESLIKIIEEHQLYVLDEGGTWPPKQEEAPAEPILNKAQLDTLAAQVNVFKPEKITVTREGREIFKNNGVKYIITLQGDNIIDLAREFDLYTWQIYEYNDLPKDADIKKGQIIYLANKRRKAVEEFYVVEPGETMHSISQKFGIRLKRLYDLNRMNYGTQPNPGDTLWMRRKKPSSFENNDGFILFRIFKGLND